MDLRDLDQGGVEETGSAAVRDIDHAEGLLLNPTQGGELTADFPLLKPQELTWIPINSLHRVLRGRGG
jgi:hypothetical protein